MSEPGLTRRLRQQSHRSGLAIGVSMALAIAVCFGGFTWIYVQLDPWARDFAGAEVAPPTPTPREESAENVPEEEQQADEEPSEEPERTATADEQPNEDDGDSGNIDPVEVDQDNSAFDPNYQIVALTQVRLRGGPSINSEILIEGLDPGTQLEFTGERQPSTNPDADGDTEWLQFRTQDGQEGWIRQIDVAET